MIEITKELRESSKGSQGFTKQQAGMAKRLLGKSWALKLTGRIVEDEWWKLFCRMGHIGVPMQSDLKPKSRPQKKKRKKKHKKKWKGDDFYMSHAWRELRYRVLRKYKAACMACGRSPKHHGIVIHVDHIKPRSKFPRLELVFENLQLLCEDCNLAKGNKDCIDWRPDTEDEAELEIVAAANDRI